MINVNGEAVFQSSSSLFESAQIEVLSTESSDSHVSWLIGQVLVTHLTRTLLDNPIVEWLRLVELFSVLSSILICVRVLLCSPACAVPEGRVHHIARAIIEECLPWSIQICLVSHVFMELNGFLLGELFLWIAILEY